MNWEDRIEDKLDKILEHQTKHEIRISKVETEIKLLKTSLKWVAGFVSSLIGIALSVVYDKLVK